MCRWTLLWMSLTSLVVAIPEEQQYCAVRYRRLCQGKGQHVACHFPDSRPGGSCERYTPIKFSTDLKNFITHYLNRRRQRIAAGNERVRGGVHLPKPEIMMLVEWDRELAFLAKRLADQCHFVHDDCRATVRYPYAGQTVGEVRWRRSSDSDELSAQRAIRRVLDAWWGERRRVQPKQLTAPFRLTAKGTAWGHFSQLAVWNLQAVGCGAVRHGFHHPRLLLVCDFSHTNMLGQKTLVSGATAPCPIHTARRPRTAYPLLCAPVRHPVPVEPEDAELEDNYEDYEEEEEDVSAVEVGDVTKALLWFSTSEKQLLNPNMNPATIREFPGQSRKIETKIIYKEITTSPATSIHQVDRKFEQKMRNGAQNVKYKEVQNTYDSQFESVVRNEWRKRPDNKKYYVPLRSRYFDAVASTMIAGADKSTITEDIPQNQENADNLEEVIPLTIPRREVTETLEPATTELYHSVIKDYVIQRSTTEEVYRPTIREDSTDNEDTNNYSRPRWRQTRIRHPRPGAHALLTCTSIGRLHRKEYIPASLNLDKEDMDQLFRDTGFSVNWRKQTT